MGYIEGQDRSQMILFPECIDDYISDDNIVRIIDSYVEYLNMDKPGFGRATPPERG